MKKYILLIVLIILLLTGCTTTEEKITLIAPSGTPSLALSHYFSTHDFSLEYEIVAGSDPLIAAFNNKTHDIIVAPVNLGAKLYKVNGNYVHYKTFVWGNTFIVSKNPINSISDLEGKDITAFGQTSIPGIVLKALLTYYNVNPNVTYVDDVATANALLMSNQVEIILSAEPSLSKINQKGNLYVLDLQELWKEMTNSTSYPQAAIFVLKDKINNETVLKHLKDIEYSINQTKNPSSTANLAAKIDQTFEKLGVDVLSKAIPNCNYGLVLDEQTPIENYFKELEKLGLSQMYGGTLPDEGFYFKHYQK